MENQHLFEIIQKLSDKIENLSDKIDDLIQDNAQKHCYPPTRSFPTKLPSVAFESWIESFVVSNTILETTCNISILEGFKQCITENFQKTRDTIPLTVLMRPKQLFVYSYFENNTEEISWQPFTEEHLNLIIQEIWRKILELFLNEKHMDWDDSNREGNTSDENYHDLCMKKILEMRKILAQRHRKEISRYLISEIKNMQ